MTRWYQGFRCKGDPETIKQLIVKQVHENDLTSFVISVKPEKISKCQTKSSPRAKSNKQNIEFYLFLQIESSEIGQLPSPVQMKLIQFLEQREQEYRGRFYKIIQWKIREGFDYEEIKVMAENDFDVYNFTQSITYRPQQRENSHDNPFNLVKFDLNEVQDLKNDTQSHEKLLYLLSTLSLGTWELFKQSCQALKLENPKSILRRLKLLGHIEISPDGKYWSIAPTALVEVSSSLYCKEFILCGQQNDYLFKKLELCSDITLKEQPMKNSPRCVRVRLFESTKLVTLIEKTKQILKLDMINAGNTAMKLADILPDIETWKVQLQKLPGIQPCLYNWKHFNGNELIECCFSNLTGMYQMFTLGEKEYPIRTLFYDAETDSWHQGDWYGLRFLALHYSNQQCIAHYDPATSRLAIPWLQRWPELYERALVLTSGLLPTYQETEQNLWLIYKNIARYLAEKLTNKLKVILKGTMD